MKDRRSIDSKIVRSNPDQMIPGTLATFANLQWEYKSVLLLRCTDINKYGLEGWELVSVSAQPGDAAVFYFKRPIIQPQ